MKRKTMKWSDLLGMSWSSLRRRKLRTVLTVMGVVIGTTAIVVMMSLGIGLTESSMAAINASGELTTIRVTKAGSMGSGKMSAAATPSNNQSEKKALDDKALAEISKLPHIKFASPVLKIPILLKKGDLQAYSELNAMSHAALAQMGFKFDRGNLPPATDNNLQYIAGGLVTQQFQRENSTMHEPAQIDLMEGTIFTILDQEAYFKAQGGEGQAPKKYIFPVSAVLYKDPQIFRMEDWSIYCDINALKLQLQKAFRGKAWPGQPRSKSGKPIGALEYNEIFVRTDDISHTKAVMQTINQMGYMANSSIEYIETMQKQANSIQAVLGGIGAVSLLVAAIGIANTMMMSIYERTKEIGVIKVLGCSLKNIRALFLLEAAIIGLLGGAIGLLLSYSLSALLNSFAGSGQVQLGMTGAKLSVIPFWLSSLSVIFATLVGMVSGFMPALRAMKLSALEAIRTQ